MIVLGKLFYGKLWQSFGLPARTCLFKHNALRNRQIPAPLGEFPSNQSSCGIHESGFKLSPLLCMIFVARVCSSEFPFFPFLIRKSLAPSFSLCNIFLNFSESVPAVLKQFEELKTVFQGWEHCQFWDKNLSCCLGFFPVNPNICHFSFCHCFSRALNWYIHWFPKYGSGFFCQPLINLSQRMSYSAVASVLCAHLRQQHWKFWIQLAALETAICSLLANFVWYATCELDHRLCTLEKSCFFAQMTRCSQVKNVI